MSEERRAVTPIRPAAAYIGGKRRLGELQARRIEAVPHETYAEPFIGARRTTTAPVSSPAPSSPAWPRGWADRRPVPPSMRSALSAVQQVVRVMSPVLR